MISLWLVIPQHWGKILLTVSPDVEFSHLDGRVSTVPDPLGTSDTVASNPFEWFIFPWPWLVSLTSRHWSWVSYILKGCHLQIFGFSLSNTPLCNIFLWLLAACVSPASAAVSSALGVFQALSRFLFWRHSLETQGNCSAHPICFPFLSAHCPSPDVSCIAET